MQGAQDLLQFPEHPLLIVINCTIFSFPSISKSVVVCFDELHGGGVVQVIHPASLESRF